MLYYTIILIKLKILLISERLITNNKHTNIVTPEFMNAGSDFDQDLALRKKSVTNYTKGRKESFVPPEELNKQNKRRKSSVGDDEFDLIDFNEEIKKANKQSPNQNRNAFIEHPYNPEANNSTFVIAKREYSIIDIDK